MREECERNAEDVDVLRLKEFDLLPGHRVGLFFRFVGGTTQAASNHLFTQQLAGEGAQTHDVGDGLGVPALGEHPDGNHVLYVLAGFADLADRVHLQAQQLGLGLLGQRARLTDVVVFPAIVPADFRNRLLRGFGLAQHL